MLIRWSAPASFCKNFEKYESNVFSTSFSSYDFNSRKGYLKVVFVAQQHGNFYEMRCLTFMFFVFLVVRIPNDHKIWSWDVQLAQCSNIMKYKYDTEKREEEEEGSYYFCQSI